jgi:uncharacterized membrane protein
MLLWCFLLGCVTGLRSMTGAAVIAWGAHLGWLHFAGTPLAFLDSRAALIVFALMAVGELVVDKLPMAPPRTAPLGLTARILFGAACGFALATTVRGSVALASIAGIAGALVGTYGGYNLRHALVTRAHLPDFLVAVAEDVVAVGGAFLIVSRVMA